MTDSAGDGCAVYWMTKSSECGNYDDQDFNANTMCCACGGGLQNSAACTDTASGATDTANFDCASYLYYPEYCGLYDQSDLSFVANEMCCECGGGSTYAPPDTGACMSVDILNTDTQGNDCSWYLSNSGDCGSYDQSDYSFQATFCCECSGGWFDTDSGPTDTNSNGCTSYIGNTGNCGNYDDDDFTANDLCTACRIA